MNQKRSLFILILFAVSLPCVLHAEEGKSWTDKIKFSGDFRYRYEFIGGEAYNSATNSKFRVYDRNRNRIRLRLGLQAMVNSDIDAYLRIATSTANSNANNTISGDPVSTNQDLSGGFTPKPIWLDRAYVDYHPSAAKWLDARGGRQPAPFQYNDELIWDGDLNVEGISLLLNHKMDKNEVFLRGGGYWAGERAASSASKHALDQGVFEGQLGGKLSTDKIGAMLAVAYIDWGNVKDNPTVYKPNTGYGNSLMPISGRGADTLGYKFDYNLFNVNANVSLKGGKVVPMLFGDFVTNTAAKKDTSAAYNKTLGTGWLVGLFLKFNKLPVDWDLTYDYRTLQKDAVIGAYSFSDPADGGTNYNGHRVTLGFAVMPNTRLGVTYLRDTKDPDNSNSQRHLGYDRIQADCEVKF
jgi:hypothetical protein